MDGGGYNEIGRIKEKCNRRKKQEHCAEHTKSRVPVLFSRIESGVQREGKEGLFETEWTKLQELLEHKNLIRQGLGEGERIGGPGKAEGGPVEIQNVRDDDIAGQSETVLNYLSFPLFGYSCLS